MNDSARLATKTKAASEAKAAAGNADMSASVLQYLKKHGQRLDSEIAAATGIPLPKVLGALAELSARGEISSCNVTRFQDGQPIEGMLCRIAGFIPPKAPGRKPGT
jgi:hypothetical protein